jgi:hypothetical protein
MTSKHERQAKAQQIKGLNHEQKGLFNLAISFYRIAKNRWQQTSGNKDNQQWCDGRILHCRAMSEDLDDDNC